MDAQMAFLIGGGIPALLGLVFWSVGFFMTKGKKAWINTKGIVIDNFRASGDDNLRPIFQFEDNKGVLYEVKSKVGQRPSIKVGTQVPVLYDPKDPSRAVIDTWLQSGRGFLLFGNIWIGIGAAVLLIGFFMTA
ncbi:DUF3592 domain-containing protein [Atopococcus tabaci]|uniref:DUF3592 domain-containing protein n=1 Tax=Atopococcus tabaci TaxID=269774 RepID=UPI00240995C1|nr:DUF3592 domain-containing protein [Atopococcus tabaci]